MSPSRDRQPDRAIHLGFQTEYFPPDTSSNALLYGRLARYLSNHVASIEVCAAHPHDHSELVAAMPLPDSVQVHRSAPPNPRMRDNLRARFLSEVVYATRSTLLAARVSRGWDVILCSTPPLLLGVGAACVASFRRIPLVWWVQDLHPDIAIVLDLTSESSVPYRILHRIHAWILKRSALIVAISDAQRAALLTSYRQVDPMTVAVLENPAAHDKPVGDPVPHDTLRVTYTGNVGLSQGLGYILDLAERAQALPVRFLIHGRGGDKARLRAEASRRGIRNVQFGNPVEDDQYRQLLQDSDVLLLSLLPGVDQYSFPSKLWTYLAAGRPILACVGRGGAVDETLTPMGAGLVVEWGRVEAGVDALRSLLDVDLRHRLTLAAERLSAAHLTAEAHAERLATLVSTCIQPTERLEV